MNTPATAANPAPPQAPTAPPVAELSSPLAPPPSAIPAATAPSVPTRAHPDLNAAFAEARHRIRALTPQQAAKEQNQGTRWFAANPGQDLVARFHDDGVRLASGKPDATWQVHLQRAGIDAVVPALSASDRVEYHHADGIVERIDNRTDGFEHSLVVPQADPQHPTRIDLDFELEGLVAHADPASTADLCFADEEGRSLLGYRKLVVTDATGRQLEASMQPSAGGFGIHVNASGAEFPVVIDPLIVSLEAQLSPRTDSIYDFVSGTAGKVSANFGRTLGIEGDTAVVGENHSVWVYARENGVWKRTQLLMELSANGYNFGVSLALSGDTLLIGDSSRTANGINGVGQMLVYQRQAGTWQLAQTLTPPDPVDGMMFGSTVALSGDTMVVGAQRGAVGQVTNAGKAYVFVRSGGQWAWQATLTASDPQSSSNFTRDLAISGDHIAIGANTANSAAGSEAGAVYLYQRQNGVWSTATKLVPEGAIANTNAGIRVDIEGDRLYIAADGRVNLVDPAIFVYRLSSGTWVFDSKIPLPARYSIRDLDVRGELMAVGSSQLIIDPSFPEFGRVRLYSQFGGTWSFVGEVTPPNLKSTDGFGWSAALSADTMVVGVVGANTDGGYLVGRADFYQLSGAAATFAQSVDAGSHGYQDQLGSSLSISENRVLAGCHQDDTADGANAGSAYIFVEGPAGWSEEAKLFSPQGAAAQWFGWSVALSGDRVLIGSPINFDALGPIAQSAGAAYAFQRTPAGWVPDGEFRNAATNPNSRDNFGWSVALDGDLALVGATASPSSPSSTGEVRIYRRESGGWTQLASLTDPQSTIVEKFGLSLAISEETLAIGGHRRGNSTLGTVSIYRREGSNFTFSQRLDVSGNSLGPNNLAVPLALSRDALLVGGPYGADIRGVTSSGRVFAYRRSGEGVWALETMLDPPVSREFGWFGMSVATHWDTALVGMPRVGTTNPIAGEVYVYEHVAGAWQRNTTIPAPVSTSVDNFGGVVAIRGTRCVIGAPGYDATVTSGGKGEDQGRIYVMNLPELVPGITSSSTFTLNRQTGLYEQTITLTNTTQQTLSGFDLTIKDLPAGLSVNNASTTRNGVPLIEFRQPLAPGQSITVVVEYFSSARGAPTAPTYAVSNVPRQLPGPGPATGLAVDRVERLPDGSMLVEFTATPGQVYQVQYSQDGQIWKTSPVSIRAAGNRVQWIDRGPPRTDRSPTTDSSRFYRISETSPNP